MQACRSRGVPPPLTSIPFGVLMIRTRAHAAQLSLNDVWWPLRSFAEWCHAIETTYLRDSGLRRAVKVAVDFCCGVVAVAIAVALDDGVGTIAVRETAGLAVAV